MATTKFPACHTGATVEVCDLSIQRKCHRMIINTFNAGFGDSWRNSMYLRKVIGLFSAGLILSCVINAPAGEENPKQGKSLPVTLIKLTPKQTSSLVNPRGKVFHPTIIATKIELAKHVRDTGAQRLILNKANLKRSNVVLFQWSGSGGDRLKISTKKLDTGVKVAEFQYFAGFTDDIQQHVHIFAVPRTMKVRVVKGQR